MVVALVGSLADDARLLEEILLDKGTLDDTILVKVDVNVLSEARRVVVADGLGVTESY